MVKGYLFRAISIKMVALSIIPFLSTAPLSGQKKQKQAVDYVNPLIGTTYEGFDHQPGDGSKYRLEGGGKIPCTGLPFAMTNFVAQTGETMISRAAYIYEDSTILGFAATRQPTLWMGDYGYVSIMPQVGSLQVLPQKRKLNFKHAEEISRPNYYSVKLNLPDDNQIKAELTSTERCGMLRFTFPKSENAHFIVQSINVNDSVSPWINHVSSVENRSKTLAAYIRINKNNREIVGYNPDRVCLNLGPELKNFKGWFVIQFEKPIHNCGVWNNREIKPDTIESFGRDRLGAYISFPTSRNEVFKVKIGTSLISLEQARENLTAEMPGWDFDALVKDTRATWQKHLESFSIEGADEDQKAIFYTALYHSLQLPRMLSENGKYYSAFDDSIHQGVSYNDYSLWDTYRALHPLLIFIQPDRVGKMITSLLNMYKEGGWLPMLPNPAETNIMIGTHADAVIADAFVKGIRNFDVNLAYEAMRKNAFIPAEGDLLHSRNDDRQAWEGFEGRAGLAFYHSIGYVPHDYKAESVSRTIEYGTDDYCIAQVAKDLGKIEDYNKLIHWSYNYKNLYHSDSGFFAPRLYNGNWAEPGNQGFTEGGPWTYLFGAMHDVEGMIAMMGGQEKFASRLDECFAGNFYRHDNEPCHHYIYLYDYCNQPWKTQELARYHTKFNYRNAPNGINGNEDSGQMSAWYIFTVMGFYPVTPASGLYALGAPQFPKVMMNYTANGKACKFEITANSISDSNMYVQSVTLDGIKLERPFITHDQIINGKQLVFEMGPEPKYANFDSN